jgi:hypothetical protein
MEENDIPKIEIEDNYVYKVHILDAQGKIFKIIYYGRNNIVDSEKEKQLIERTFNLADNASLIYSSQQILYDDSIQIIKRKILKDLWVNTDLRPSYEEMYLFAQVKQSTPLQQIFFSALNQQECEEQILVDKSELYAQNANRLLVNLGEKITMQKEKYSFSDINNLATHDTISLSRPLGMKNVGKEENHLFHFNPYINKYGANIEYPLLEHYENTVLLSCGEIVDNNIYLCLAENVLSYFTKNQSQYTEAMMSLYFRLLYTKDIKTLDDLLISRNELVKNTKEMIDNKVFQLYDTIQIFHDVYHTRKSDIQYVQRGIHQIFFQIVPDYNNLLPLEIIFKSLHASPIIPFIKYNHGERREKIYRIYSTKTSKNGKKIPYLTDKQIMKLTREMGKSGQISLYIQTHMDAFSTLYIHFEMNGKISVECVFKKPYAEEDVNTQIKDVLNPIFVSINSFLEKTGFAISLFESLRHSNVQIIDLKYTVSTRISNKIALKTLGCLYGVFNIYNENIEEGASLRFKRVNNYVEMDAKMTYISEKRHNIQEAISGLISNFQMSEVDAKVEIAKYFENNIDNIGNVLNNPGFPVSISVLKLEDILEIEVNKIDDVRYIDVLSIYFDSLIRITQKGKSTSVSRENINKICRGAKDLAKREEPKIVIPPKVVAPYKPSLDFDILGELGIELDENKIGNMDESLEEDEGVFFDEYEEEESKESVSLSQKNQIEEQFPKSPYTSVSPPNQSSMQTKEVPSPTVGVHKEKPQSPISEDEGVFFSDEDEDDDEEQEGGEEDDDEVSIGDEDIEKYKLNPTGMPLNNPNPFLRKKKLLDPKLYVIKKTGKYKSYSSNCQPVNRQPIILTDEEKKKIDQEHPGSYLDAAIQYGTDPDNKYWYVCPRYWCFLTNSPISKEEVEAGKCGKVIPDKAKRIPEGSYVYEFKSKDHFDEKGNYIDHYPGFMLKEDLHPDGYCLPCCFKGLDTKKQKERKDKCFAQNAANQKETQSPKKTIHSNYIISLDTYPLDRGRFGFLPMSAQYFVGTNYFASIDKNNPKEIKPHTPVMLRYGVEQSPHQSFLGVFADVYGHMQRKSTPSVKELKTIIREVVDIDIFMKLHNGSLVSVFKPKIIPNMQIAKYSSSQIYKSINHNNKEQKQYLRDVIAAYNNFMDYISDDKQVIDHTYMWDLFCMNIPALMKGVNLILLEVVENDITDKIEYICPTNVYSSHIYNAKYETVIVLKHDEFYEPIYMYKYVNGNIELQRTFNEKTLYHQIKQMIINIKYTSNKYCSPLPSLPKVYKFKQPIMIHKLVELCKSNKYQINKQIANYNGKTIGLLVSVKGTNGHVIEKQSQIQDAQVEQESQIQPPAAPPVLPAKTIQGKMKIKRPPKVKEAVAPQIIDNAQPEEEQPMVGGGPLGNTLFYGGDGEVNQIFIPCYPATILDNISSVFFDELDIWKDYKSTRDILLQIHSETGGKIPCRPVIKVIENGLIVGIITETHQFVRINPPSENIFMDGLDTINNSDLYEMDKQVSVHQKGDKQREELVKNIHLETQFYSTFRSVFRKLLNNFDHKDMRNKIIKEIENKDSLYSQKIDRISVYLKQVGEKAIDFEDISREVLMDLNEINVCSEYSPEQSPYCMVKEDGNLKLIIPSKHLLSKHDNETIYYARLADELVRYNRVRLFMFQPKTYLNINNIDYQINDNEFIIIHTLLTGDYLDNLSAYNENSYVHNNNAEFASPSQSQTYANDIISVSQQQYVDVGDNVPQGQQQECMKEASIPIVGNSSSMWVKSFPKVAREMIFYGSPNCTFHVLIKIIREWKKLEVTPQTIKGALWNAYEKLLPKYSGTILNLLKSQGKTKLVELVAKQRASFESMVLGEGYFITDLDIWVMANMYNLPIILFTATRLKGVLGNIKWLKLGGKKDDNFFFIRSPLNSDRNQEPEYNLVYPQFKLYELGMFTEEYQKAVNGDIEYMNCLQTLPEMLEKIIFVKK